MRWNRPFLSLSTSPSTATLPKWAASQGALKGLCVLSLLLVPSLAVAQPEPSTEIPAGELTSDHIWALDQFRIQMRESRYNRFALEEKQAEYFEAVNKLNGALLSWTATVNRVTEREVRLRTTQWGRTRIVLIHFNEQGMAYGNPGFQRRYCHVQPSAQRYVNHAAESTLEIGLEIPLELARTLRHDDLVQISGRIEQVDTRLNHGNSPDTLLYMANIQAVKYLTEEEKMAAEEGSVPLKRRN